MPRCGGLAFKALATFLYLSFALWAGDQALWQEFGLLHTQTAQHGKLSVTTYQLKDLTGALAAWEWQRSHDGHTCDLAPFCNQDEKRTVLSDDNYVIVFAGGAPTKAQVAETLKVLPDKRGSALPAILSFLPQQGMVPNSARYVLGPESANAFVPELSTSKLGFEDGAEAQVVAYQLKPGDKPVRLAIFDYATPEMARLHAADLKRLPNVYVKRSGVLLAIVLPPATQEESDTLLSRVQYEAKITWNDVPPPSPIKPMYLLLRNIIYFSVLLSALALAAGLMYACMRVYRRRYGTLDAEEAMTTLHLTGD